MLTSSTGEVPRRTQWLTALKVCLSGGVLVLSVVSCADAQRASFACSGLPASQSDTNFLQVQLVGRVSGPILLEFVAGLSMTGEPGGSRGSAVKLDAKRNGALMTCGGRNTLVELRGTWRPDTALIEHRGYDAIRIVTPKAQTTVTPRVGRQSGLRRCWLHPDGSVECDQVLPPDQAARQVPIAPSQARMLPGFGAG